MNNFFERRYIIAGIFITLVIILLARLYYIQIVDDRYTIYAKSNVVRKIIQYPARGPILDRNNHSLVQNELVYDVTVIPKNIKPFDTLEFCKLIGITKDEFQKKLKKAIAYSPNLESPFDKQLSPELFASLQERMSEFPGFSIQPHPVRTYPDSTAAVFLGYIGEATEKVIVDSGGYYRRGDYIGISGVERSYEALLRGTRGVKNMMVDSRGVPKGRYANGAFADNGRQLFRWHPQPHPADLYTPDHITTPVVIGSSNSHWPYRYTGIIVRVEPRHGVVALSRSGSA